MSFRHLDDVLEEVAPLGRIFSDAGHRLFLVGGIVRDQWLDEPLDESSDIDLTTNALPPQIKQAVASYAEDLWTQGEKFGTIGLRAGGRDYEITTHRAESYASDSRKPQVSFGDDIDVDLSRRDFTVNAMAIELPDGELVDPYGGAKDLAARRLRTPLSPGVSFTDDPLRMLRAARFSTKYSLVPDQALVASATELHQRIRIVAIERIGVELRRLLDLDDARVGLTFLADTGLLAEVLAYGEHSLIDQITPRLGDAIGRADELPARWRMRLAAIGLAVFEAPDQVYAMCRRLRLAKEHERYIVRLSRSATQAMQTALPDDETVRRWIDTCQEPDAAFELAAVLAPDADRLHGFIQAFRSLQANEDPADHVALDGATIMSLLRVEPGPVIGQAQKFLRDQYFKRGPLSTEEQRELLLAWSSGALAHER